MRIPYWTGAVAVGLVATVVVAVRAQEPSGSPRHFSGKGQPGFTPAPPIRPEGYLPPPEAVPSRQQTPMYTSQFETPAQPGWTRPQPASGNRPRITQPVMATSEGIVPASGLEPVPTATPIKVTPAAPTKPVAPPTTSMKPLVQPTLTEPTIEAPTEPRPLALTPVPLTAPTEPMAPTTPTATATNMTILPPSVSASATTPIVPATPTVVPSQPTVSPSSSLPTRQAPNVVVEMVAPEAIGVGQPLTYDLVVRNIGSTSVSNVKLEDELPAKSMLVSTEPPAETSGERLSWSIGTLEAAAERKVKVTIKLTEEGEIRSRATVSFTAAVDSRVRVTRPRLTVAVSAPESARVGEKIPFQIRLGNTGSGTAVRVVLQARLTDGLTHPHGSPIEAEIVNLAAGQTKSITLEATALKGGSQACVLLASADGNPAETAKAAVNLVEPLLTLKQTGPAKCLVRGEPVYQIELANPGTASTDPLAVWAVLPEGFDFVQASDAGTFAAGTRTVNWRLPALPTSQSRTLTLKLRATSPVDGTIRTAAQAMAAQAEVEGAGGSVVAAGLKVAPPGKTLEARAETAVKAEGIAALRFDVVDVEDPVEVGKDAMYEIRVSNQGTGPSTGVQLVADLGDGTTAVGASGPSTGRASGQQVVFDAIPQIGPKQEATYRIRVRGSQPGDARFRVRITSDQIRTPITKEENTRFVKE